MTRSDTRTFRSPSWVVAVTAACALIFVAVALVSYVATGFSWTTIVLLCLLPLATGGVIDVLTQRVELHEERIVIVRNLRRREYPRNMFVKAQWGKGVPVSLQSTSGEWIQLPGVGSSGQGLVNSLRAWIKV